MKFLCYLPALIASLWTRYRERDGSKKGRSLSATELQIIEALDIQSPENVRIHYLDRISHPFRFFFDRISKITKMVTTSPIGITIGYTILLDKKHIKNLPLLIHELVHVKQYETMGGHISFLQEYIYQCIKYGYNNCPLEQEADDISKNLLRENSLRLDHFKN